MRPPNGYGPLWPRAIASTTTHVKPFPAPVMTNALASCQGKTNRPHHPDNRHNQDGS